MKKIIKPAKKEKAKYYSDFSGEKFGDCGPEAEIKFVFNYGSRFDGEKIKLHLSDSESVEVLDFIKQKLSKEKKKQLASEEVSPLGDQSHLKTYLTK